MVFRYKTFVVITVWACRDSDWLWHCQSRPRASLIVLQAKPKLNVFGNWYVDQAVFALYVRVCLKSRQPPPPSVWPHLFRGAGHEKRRGEQLKWSLAFSLHIGSFPCAQHSSYSPVGLSVFFCIFSPFIYVSLICLCVPILLCFPGQLSHLP